MKYDPSSHNMYESSGSSSKPTNSASMYNTTSTNNNISKSPPIVKDSPPSSTYHQPAKSTLLQELLECPICMNLFDNPHVLPCQHTFCKKCIVSLQNNTGSGSSPSLTIDCPICREKHTLVNGVDGLTANYTMKRLIELDAIQLATEKERMQKEAKEKSEREEAAHAAQAAQAAQLALTKEVVKPLKAKCFSCQKFAYLKVCSHCSYTLCYDCNQNPDHDIIIGRLFLSKFPNFNKPKFRKFIF